MKIENVTQKELDRLLAIESMYDCLIYYGVDKLVIWDIARKRHEKNMAVYNEED